MMIMLVDVPLSLQKRLMKKQDKVLRFSQIEGVYRDGMDWMQYDEIIPRISDKEKYDELFTDEGKPKNEDDFVSRENL